MIYKTSKPIVTRSGESLSVSRGELIRSPHPEVRAAAFRGRAFIFGGVRFEPGTDSARTPKREPTALAHWAKHVCPASNVDMVPATQSDMHEALDHCEATVAPALRTRQVAALAAGAALTFVLSLWFGFAAGRTAVYAQPVCDPKTDESCR
jgi:hypothetical protein